MQTLNKCVGLPKSKNRDENSRTSSNRGIAWEKSQARWRWTILVECPPLTTAAAALPPRSKHFCHISLHTRSIFFNKSCPWRMTWRTKAIRAAASQCSQASLFLLCWNTPNEESLLAQFQISICEVQYFIIHFQKTVYLNCKRHELECSYPVEALQCLVDVHVWSISKEG